MPPGRTGEQVIAIADWNGTTTPWAQDSIDSGKPARLPRLRWQGEEVTSPPAEQATASIELMPTPGLEHSMPDVIVKGRHRGDRT